MSISWPMVIVILDVAAITVSTHVLATALIMSITATITIKTTAVIKTIKSIKAIKALDSYSK